MKTAAMTLVTQEGEPKRNSVEHLFILEVELTDEARRELIVMLGNAHTSDRKVGLIALSNLVYAGIVRVVGHSTRAV